MSSQERGSSSEFREDPTSGEWVLVAPARGSRPDELGEDWHIASQAEREWDPDCPFCPGNEGMTPREVLRMPDESAWKLRVVPNKFAVLDPHTSWTKTNGSGLFRAMAGFGRHEVVVETPSHHRPMSEMEGAEVEAILQAYQKREEELRSDPRIKFVLIFKNQGQRAGASLAHPHSQITATSLVPPAVWQKVEKARAHRAIHDRCMYCDMRDKEAADGSRVVAEGQRFIVLHPFASRMPFETWILPKRHIPTLGGLGRAELNELGALLRNTMRGLAVCLDAPDWSYVLQAAPVQEDREESFLWHIEILPRTTTRAGFELGTGINITTALPEETATILRKEF